MVKEIHSDPTMHQTIFSAIAVRIHWINDVCFATPPDSK